MAKHIAKVVALFDGMGCGLQALKEAGFTVGEYHAFEIDKYAKFISSKNHPEIIHHGEITFMTNFKQFKGADLLIGGSPCQGLSVAGKLKKLKDPRSQLFYEFVRAKEEIKPNFFMLENVKMDKVSLKTFSELLGVEPILINSALVSAQNRKRYYWCNWETKQPEDKGIMLKDIVHEFVDTPLQTEKTHNYRLGLNLKDKNDKATCLTATCYKGAQSNGMTNIFEELNEYIVPFDKTLQILDKEVERGKLGYFNTDSQGRRVYYVHGEAVTLYGDAGGAAKMGQYLFGCITPDRVNKRQNGQRFNDGRKFYTLTAQDKHGILIEGYIRKLTPIECERLMGLPDDYTAGVSNTQRYKMNGNGWEVATIVGLFTSNKRLGTRNAKD